MVLTLLFKSRELIWLFYSFVISKFKTIIIICGVPLVLINTHRTLNCILYTCNWFYEELFTKQNIGNISNKGMKYDHFLKRESKWILSSKLKDEYGKRIKSSCNWKYGQTTWDSIKLGSIQERDVCMNFWAKKKNAKLGGGKKNWCPKLEKKFWLKWWCKPYHNMLCAFLIFPFPFVKQLSRKLLHYGGRLARKKFGLHRKRWEILKTRKDMGGLGFRDLIAFIKATLGK